MTDENAAKIIEQLTLIASHLQTRGEALQSIDRKLAAIDATTNGHQAPRLHG